MTNFDAKSDTYIGLLVTVFDELEEQVVMRVSHQGNEEYFIGKFDMVLAPLGLSNQPADKIWKVLEAFAMWVRKPMHPSGFGHLPRTLDRTISTRARRCRTTLWLIRWGIGRYLRSIYMSSEQARWNQRDELSRIKLPMNSKTKPLKIPTSNPFADALKKTIEAVKLYELNDLITPSLVFEHVVSDCFMGETGGLLVFNRVRELFLKPVLMREYSITLSKNIEKIWPFPWAPMRLPHPNSKRLRGTPRCSFSLI